MENNTNLFPAQDRLAQEKTPKKTFPFTKKDGVFAIIVFLLSLFMVDSVLFSGYNLGFTISAALLIITCAVYCLKKDGKPTWFSVFSLISAILIGISFAIFKDAFVTFCGVALILVLVALGILDIAKQTSYSPTDDRSIYDVFRFWIKLPFTKMGIAFRSAFSFKKKKEGKDTGLVLAGILCAVPVAIIVFFLLVSSDAAFEGFLDKIIFSDDLSEPFASFILGSIFFVILFSVIFSIAKRDAKITPNEKADGPLPSNAITAFLSVISGVYILYMLSQFAYFFNAFLGILPENFTVSDYARRGFFEMCIICFINLAIIVISIAVVKKKDESGVIPKEIKAITTFIAAFSLLLTITAMSKMFMYMNEHGLTRKRIVTSVFMVVMLIVLTVTILKIFIKKLHSLKIIVTAVTIIGIAVCFVDIDSTVARYNTEKYLAGEINTDAEYIDELSDSAVPYILELAKSDTPLGKEAKAKLKDRFIHYFLYSAEEEELEFDLQNYNYSRQKAKELLAENRAFLFSKN